MSSSILVPMHINTSIHSSSALMNNGNNNLGDQSFSQNSLLGYNPSRLPMEAPSSHYSSQGSTSECTLSMNTNVYSDIDPRNCFNIGGEISLSSKHLEIDKDKLTWLNDYETKGGWGGKTVVFQEQRGTGLKPKEFFARVRQNDHTLVCVRVIV